MNLKDWFENKRRFVREVICVVVCLIFVGMCEAAEEVYADIDGAVGSVANFWDVSARGGGTTVCVATATISGYEACDHSVWLCAWDDVDNWFIPFRSFDCISAAHPLDSRKPFGFSIIIR